MRVDANRLLPLPLEDLDHVLACTRDCWDRARGKRFFMTGGTGFFGQWLLETFVAANDRFDLEAHAVVLTRDADAFRTKAPHLSGEPCLSFLSGDIAEFSFPEGNFDYVVHAATVASRERDANASVVEGISRIWKEQHSRIS